MRYPITKWTVIFLVSACLGGYGQPNSPPYLFKGDNSYPPYEFIDETGNPAGFNIDLLHAVAQVMQIPIRVELDTWNQVRFDLETGQIDGITGMYYSKTRSEHVIFSVPFILVSHSIFVRDDASFKTLTDLHNQKILVQAGDIMHDFVRQNNLTQHIIQVENSQIALKHLAAGKGDAALLARLQGLFYVQALGLKNVKTIGPAIEPTEYCIAVKNGNAALVSQINEGLNIVKNNGTYHKIYQKWFGIYEESLILKNIKYFIWGFVFILFFLITGFLWNVSLKIQVARRTSDLNNEIAERIEIEKALRSSEEKYRFLFQTSNDAIYLLYQSKFEIINDKFQSLFKVSLADVQQDEFTFMWLVAEKSKQQIRERQEKLQRGEDVALNYEFTAISTDGTEIEVEASVSYIQYKAGIATLGILRDITARKKLEAEIQQIQKLEAIGTLAGGIAHDFNNVLTAVIGHAEVILSQIETWNPIYDDVLAIKAVGKRAEELTRKILAFSRKQIYTPQVIDLNASIREIERILRRLINEDIHLKFDLTPELPNIKADPGQIEQILINLVINARDAVNQQIQTPQTKQIRIETRSVQTDDWFIANQPHSFINDWIIFSVHDNGIGMDATVKAKIFEPFFTTKEVGKGTGLGLAMVYGIVQQNSARIYVESEINVGSVFKIYWPAAPGKKKTLAEPQKSELVRGSATILLVEDDETILKFTVSALQKLGYAVISARNGREALELLHTGSPQIDLLITDLVMPFMSGWDLARQVEALIAGVRVLYISGYVDNQTIPGGILVDSVNFLQKPYSLHVLSQCIYNLLHPDGN